MTTNDSIRSYHKTIELLKGTTPNNQESVGVSERFFTPGELVSNPKPNMPLLDAIITRRTARSYKSEPVPFALFNEIVNL